MSGPSLDLSKPNMIGGLDRLVTSFAISAIAVLPTLAACILMPWRLAPQLRRDDPDGRLGMLLAPGAYFPLALMVAFILAALLATPETLNQNNSFIGPKLAVSVKNAASEGDIWKLIAIVMPIYGTAVIIGLLGSMLKPWAPAGWTLRTSLRAAFYVIATLITWLLLTSSAMDWMRVSSGKNSLPSIVHAFIIFPTVFWYLWVYFWFFEADGTASKLRSAVLAAAMFGLTFGNLAAIDFIIRL